MSIINIILLYFLPIIGFLFALFLLIQLPREQRSPSTTIAWVLAILFLPYLGVPLYLLFGGRKVRRVLKRKKNLQPMQNFDTTAATAALNTFFSPPFTFPSQIGCDPTLILNGSEALQQLINVLTGARTNIYIMTFILGNDHTGKKILAILTEKARQGVDVCLLMDALGSIKISQGFMNEFKEAGGKYAFFMPMLRLPLLRGRANLRNHRKMVLIDNTIAIIGGMNLSKDYMDINNDRLWKDLSILLHGPVVGDLLTIFNNDWTFSSKFPVTHANLNECSNLPQPNSIPPDSTALVQLVPSGPDVEDDPLHDAVLSAIFSAQKKVWIVTPYFMPDEMIIKALCIAVRRSIDVTIIVPHQSNHRLADFVRYSYLRHLQDNGVAIVQYLHGMIHGKVIIVDDTLSIVGSMNMDMRSFFLNYEIALFIHSEKLTRQLAQWIDMLRSNALHGVKPASVFIESVQGIARLLAPLL
ncbi:MAG: cardiolipin synthase [Chitinivibrionales bacterium]|nr:cardiolipin synthase [Chitinivibrionales bacterium]